IALPRLDGLAVTRAVAGLPVRVVLLTAHEGDEHVLGAIAAGAAGFLGKDAPPGELIAAVRAVAAGGAVIAPRVLARILPRVAEGGPGAGAGRGHPAGPRPRSGSRRRGRVPGLSGRKRPGHVDEGTMRASVDGLRRRKTRACARRPGRAWPPGRPRRGRGGPG